MAVRLKPHRGSDEWFNSRVEHSERGLRLEHVHPLLGCIVGMTMALLEPGFVIKGLSCGTFAIHLGLAIPTGGQCHQHQQDNQAAGPQQPAVTDDLTHILGSDDREHVSSSCA